jgi:hypothetical protein
MFYQATDVRRGKYIDGIIDEASRARSGGQVLEYRGSRPSPAARRSAGTL